MKGVASLLILALMLFLLESASYAFCVYNKTDAEIMVTETKGGKGLSRFKAIISANNHACCNWKNKDCNTGGKRDSIVRFKVEYLLHTGRDSVVYVPICQDFPIKAGGWLEVVGKNQHYQCKGYYQ